RATRLRQRRPAEDQRRSSRRHRLVRRLSQAFVLPNTTLWANMVDIGEVLVGIGLVLAALTGIAAFFGTVMNTNYLLAGTLSTNPLLFIVGTWLVLAWRVAGWRGLDRWLLPLLGTPWAP